MKEIEKGRYDIERKVGNNPFSRSKVSIIIPFHGEYEKVARCIDSILSVTKSNPYQICLVDDASPSDGFFIKIMESRIAKAEKPFLPQVVGVRSEQHLGFGGALMLGIKNTTQPWVLLMHSDVVIKNQNWMLEMGKTLIEYKDVGIKMVSAKSNNPGEGSKDLKSDVYKADKDLMLSSDEWLPLYCAMCHRDLFKHIGPIKSYPYVGYEDRELAFRMRKFGFKQGICGKSWVFHEGGGTIDKLSNEIYKEPREIGKPIRKVRDIVAENKLRYENDVKKNI